MTTKWAWNVAKDLMLGDVDDEMAPLVKITFHNEFAKMNREEKVRVLLEAVGELA